MSLTVVLVLILNVLLSESKICEYRFGLNASAVCVKSRLCSKDEYGTKCVSVNNEIVLHSTNITFAKISFNHTMQSLEVCSFYNLPKLKVVDGTKSNIYNIDLKAFDTLPQLRYLYLSFNTIEQLQKGFLQRAPSLEILDLSWNQIYRIQDGSFEGTNMRVVNLSRNLLNHFRWENGFRNLKEIILSHNFLTTIDDSITGPRLRLPKDMLLFDLSFNTFPYFPRLACLDPFNYCFIRLLDLTHNYLVDMTGTMDNVVVLELRLAFNRISMMNRGVNSLLPVTMIQGVSVYPNPWPCPFGWQAPAAYLRSSNTMILSPESDPRFNFTFPYPVCREDSAEGLKIYREKITAFVKHIGAVCESNKECPEDMLCRARRCWDPCKHGACGPTEVCIVSNYTISCQCPKGTLKDPMRHFSKCYNVECFIDSDCQGDSKCKYHICE